MAKARENRGERVNVEVELGGVRDQLVDEPKIARKPSSMPRRTQNAWPQADPLTVLSLFVVPAFYVLSDRIKRWLSRRAA